MYKRKQIKDYRENEPIFAVLLCTTDKHFSIKLHASDVCFRRQTSSIVDNLCGIIILSRAFAMQSYEGNHLEKKVPSAYLTSLEA